MNSAERREARYQRRKAARMEKKAAALREYGDFETVFSFERLYESYRASVRGVGWKASTQRYKAASLANVTKTHEELIAGRYRSKGFYEFDIVERGKPRHIRSVHISERVVQRCLCDYCLVPMLSRSFIYDNGASLRGKGYDFAVSRVTHFLAEHYRKHGREGYVLVFDFSKYFDTAQHEPVFREFERSGIDDRLVALSKYFIQNFGDVGLGLGSQVSQIAALALPNRIDHYIKDVLGMKYYARYMDDGCIISESKEKLELCLRELRRLCAEHGIRLNPKKTQIIKLTRGFTFVKVRFRYGANGKVVRRATYKGIRHMRKKLRIFRRWVDSGRMTAADVETSLVSWRGHMKRFHSYHMEQSVERLQALLKLAPELDQKIRAWLSELDIAEPDWDDYMDFDQVYYLGLATILQQVIEEAEGLRLTACDDSSGATYLIYQPCYPWEITDRERDLTEESLVQMFSRYVR